MRLSGSGSQPAGRLSGASRSHSSGPPHPALLLEGYLVLSDLGPGRGGRTCKVREKPHSQVPPYIDELEPCYALKCVDLDEALPADSKQRAVQEMQKLLNLQHPNVARYHRAFLYDGRMCVMTEFAECGTLHHLVYTVKERGQRLPDALVWHLFTQICHGLKKLHDSGVVHRALKTRNLLLFSEQLYAHPYLKYRVKLTDLAIPELQRHVRLNELDGSRLRYLAPEVLAKELGDEKVDVWALGCVLFEMVTLSHAFNATSAIQKAECSPLPEHVSPEIREVLDSIFQLDPERRPTVDELLRVPSVASCAAEMPNPVLLDGSHAQHLAGSEAAAKQAGASPGTAVWAKQPSDGLWHRGVVHSTVDADCCLVHFNERRTVELVWHDGLRAILPSPGLGSDTSRATSSSSSLACRDELPSSYLPRGRGSQRGSEAMVRWSEELSSQGDDEAGKADEHSGRNSNRGSFATSNRTPPVSDFGSLRGSQRTSEADERAALRRGSPALPAPPEEPATMPREPRVAKSSACAIL